MRITVTLQEVTAQELQQLMEIMALQEKKAAPVTLEIHTGVAPPLAAGVVSVPKEMLLKDRLNTAPPGEACSKIGTDTKIAILAAAKADGKTAEEINKALKRGEGKLPETVAALKLLWLRGDLNFDGAKYYC